MFAIWGIMTAEILSHYLFSICLGSCIFYGFLSFLRLVMVIRTLGKAVDQFPMDKKHWLKGHMEKMAGPGEMTISYFMKLMHDYPKACGLYLTCLRPYVVVHHPDTVKVILKKLGGKPQLLGMYRYGQRWLGDGLLLSSGSKWLRNRKLITPVFHFEALKHYITVDNQTSDIFLDNLSKLAKSNSPFEMYSLASLLTFDTILRCAFSYVTEVQTKGEENVYLRAIDEMGRLWMKRQYVPFHHFDFIYWRTKDGKTFLKHCETTNQLAKKLIAQRKKLIKDDQEKANSYHDFLDILLRSKDEDGFSLTDDEIRDEINTFNLAGYETTAGAISWTLYSLARNPEYQRRCQREVDDLMSGRANDYLTWKDLQELTFLSMCVKESLRLYGPPVIERELDEDTVIDGKTVPSGTAVMINLYTHHRNPEVWEDPLTFDPERFLAERSKNLDPFAYVPFSAGSRNCIGQAFALEEIKVVLARTLKRFNFTVKENHTPLPQFALILKSENGIYLEVSERNKND